MIFELILIKLNQGIMIKKPILKDMELKIIQCKSSSLISILILLNLVLFYEIKKNKNQKIQIKVNNK